MVNYLSFTAPRSSGGPGPAGLRCALRRLALRHRAAAAAHVAPRGLRYGAVGRGRGAGGLAAEAPQDATGERRSGLGLGLR